MPHCSIVPHGKEEKKQKGDFWTQSYRRKLFYCCGTNPVNSLAGSVTLKLRTFMFWKEFISATHSASLQYSATRKRGEEEKWWLLNAELEKKTFLLLWNKSGEFSSVMLMLPFLLGATRNIIVVTREVWTYIAFITIWKQKFWWNQDLEARN